MSSISNYQFVYNSQPAMMMNDVENDWKVQNMQWMYYNSQPPVFNSEILSGNINSECNDFLQHQNKKKFKNNDFPQWLNQEGIHDSYPQVDLGSFISNSLNSKKNNSKYGHFENFNNRKDEIEIKCSPFGNSEKYQQLLDKYCWWVYGNKQCSNEPITLCVSHSMTESSSFRNKKLHYSTSINPEVKDKISKNDYLNSLV